MLPLMGMANCAANGIATRIASNHIFREDKMGTDGEVWSVTVSNMIIIFRIWLMRTRVLAFVEFVVGLAPFQNLPFRVLRLSVDVQVQPAEIFSHDSQGQKLTTVQHQDGHNRRRIAGHLYAMQKVESSEFPKHVKEQCFFQGKLMRGP